MEFIGKVAVVTGAGKGIGKTVALAFAQEGARVTIADIDLESARQTVEEIKNGGGEAIASLVDVSDSARVKAMVEETVKCWGTVDILVNNAGISNSVMIEDMTEEQWRQVIDVNLTGVFLCSKAVLPVMKAKRYGKIVNVASIAGKRMSIYGGANYTASKAGVIGFTRHLAYEVAPYGINVNCICPGVIATPLIQQISSLDNLNEVVRITPKGRLCTPDDQAKAILLLASDRTEMICGVALDVDGGSLLGWMDNESYEKARKKKSMDGRQGNDLF